MPLPLSSPQRFIQLFLRPFLLIRTAKAEAEEGSQRGSAIAVVVVAAAAATAAAAAATVTAVAAEATVEAAYRTSCCVRSRCA